MMKINSGMVARFAEDDEQLDEDFEGNKISCLEMGLVFSPLLPHTFNQVLYLEDQDAPGTLHFVKDEPLKSNFTQAYLGTQIQFSASFGLSSGLLARSFAPMTVESDLGASYLNSVAVHRYTVVGFGMPFLFRWVYGTGNTQLVLSEGLQWDMSYLRYRLYTRDQDEEETLILNHFSLLNTVSLKAEIGASFKVGLSNRLNITLGFVLPVFEFSDAKITENGSKEVFSSQQKEDLILALNHKRSDAGVDMMLSFGLGF
jgi:hypothetical protein